MCNSQLEMSNQIKIGKYKSVNVLKIFKSSLNLTFCYWIGSQKRNHKFTFFTYLATVTLGDSNPGSSLVTAVYEIMTQSNSNTPFVFHYHSVGRFSNFNSCSTTPTATHLVVYVTKGLWSGIPLCFSFMDYTYKL